MSLKEIQAAAGAIFEGDIALSFNNDDEAIAAVKDNVAICDRSHWGLLKITGSDRLRYLHNQSTNDVEKLKPGDSCDTVFVTPTARTLDLATAYITEDEAIVLVSPQRREQLLTWLDKFIFPFDKVKLTDISAEYAVFSLLGEQSNTLLSQLTTDDIAPLAPNKHQIVSIDGISVRIATGSGLATSGYTLILHSADAEAVWSKIIKAGAVPFGDRLWESLRIQQGRPKSDREITEDYNPLEAGLWQTISFEKGCYIGQETIARLNTYNGVKQRLWGIKLDRPVAPDTPILVGDKKVGILTSYTETSTGSYGLGYVRTKAGGEGLQVKIGEAMGMIKSLPFVTHK
ncbi:MAG: folate-binding protein [Cyanobacteria bacterium P01_G01_bin.19]